MKIIILDYTDGKVKILNHSKAQIEDIEELLYEKYDLSQDNTYFMTVKDLVIEYLNEDAILKATFTIDESEIEELAQRKLSKLELSKTLSYIENDESIWNAIENSKKEALLSLKIL